jgi:tellurium resistance protein TerD
MPAVSISQAEDSMTVNLIKGGNVSLTEQADGGLMAVTIGLGWDGRTTTGHDFDLDASALAVGANNKVLSDKHFIFYGNLTSPDGAIAHSGDNLEGGATGDDEQIWVNLPSIPLDIDRIVFAVSIHEADLRHQSFGQVRNSYIRVLNDSDGHELARYDLSEDASTETAMNFGELYRNGSDWKFRAVGQGYADGLQGVAIDFGVDIV